VPTRPTRPASPLHRVCVFCGSSPGRDPAFVEAAVDLGRTLAERGATLPGGLGTPAPQVTRVEPKWIDL